MRLHWLIHRTLACVGAILIALAASAADSASDASKPGKQELSGAQHRLKQFARKVELARGQPMKLGFEENEALDRIKNLKEKYPDDPEVEELFQEARKLLIASKGDVIVITPEMTSYRENEQKLKQVFAEAAEKEWASLRAQAEQSADYIAKPFPPTDREDATIAEMSGRFVILEDFRYPANQFKDMGREFVSIGTPSRGYYFVELSNRSWAGAYAAFKRYRRLVNRDIPEDGKWVLLGRVMDLDLLIPQASEEKTDVPRWGWTVEPVAIHVAGCTLAVADRESEVGGHFSGEADMEKIKSAFYTVTSIPDDVTPEGLLDIFAAAIKEKNYPLYLDCIDPARRKTPIALDLCQYHWDWHQHRFATFYVLTMPEPATITVIEGFDEGGEVEDFFLTEEEKESIRKVSGDLVEQAEVRSRAYDENGRQYGSPKTFFLRRTNKGRWYIVNYAQPF
ncbi:MAG: hypothetical protein JW889_16225 [Verrucomicrobia bacterium]|nr:hypothetical protein [Verrucomicrobiota bacterium]